MFYIHCKIHECFGTQNYEYLIHLNKWPFFKARWPLLVVFCSLVSLVNKIQLVKAIWPFKRSFILGNQLFIVFLIPTFILFTMNVEKEQYSNQGTTLVWHDYAQKFYRSVLKDSRVMMDKLHFLTFQWTKLFKIVQKRDKW